MGRDLAWAMAGEGARAVQKVFEVGLGRSAAKERYIPVLRPDGVATVRLCNTGRCSERK
jgi:hypothetical protein